MFLDEFPYPFKPQSIDIPDLVLNTIQNTDILFLGERHVDSIFLLEKHSNQKAKYISHRLDSLNQENIYFHLIDRFSKIHEEAKKCLWLEYKFNDPYLEEDLKGLHPFASHYYLINTAKAKGWKVFPVDKDGSLNSRDQFMAEQIAQSIKSGLCDKGITLNGKAHLSGYTAYFNKHNLKYKERDEYLNELVKIELENLNLGKRIGFFIMENWREIQILRTREDVLSAYKAGQRDFASWNLQGVNLREALLARADFQEANLRFADLQGANLYEADLRGADLVSSNLREANLKWADLRDANLRGADLREANLRGAKYNSQTQFSDNFNPKSRGMVFIFE